jgi:hypothetical protein
MSSKAYDTGIESLNVMHLFRKINPARRLLERCGRSGGRKDAIVAALGNSSNSSSNITYNVQNSVLLH